MVDEAEREFDRFLAGEHPLQAELQQTLVEKEPPSALDQTVLQAAQTAATEDKRRPEPVHLAWSRMAILSTAASILLAVIFFVRIDQDWLRGPTQSGEATALVQAPKPAGRNEAGLPVPATADALQPLAADTEARLQAPTPKANLAPGQSPVPAQVAKERGVAQGDDRSELQAASPAKSKTLMSGTMATAPETERAPAAASVLEKKAGAADEPSPWVACPALPKPPTSCPHNPAETGPAVCALVDTGVRCIKAPCPAARWQTLADACHACATEHVLGYRAGACKEGEQDQGR